MKHSMTQENILKNLLTFALPYLGAYFLQRLYGMADLFIVGQFYGTDAITAVSLGGQVMNLLTVMIVGLAMGTTILIGRAVGAEDNARISKVIGNTVTTFMGVSIVATVLLLILLMPILHVLQTPVEAMSGAQSYLFICFLGIPFITAYNVLSAIFRGMGDSKSPMMFVFVACVCNIVLDYLFIGGMHLGATGAALGTILSQAISVVLSLIWIKRGSVDLHVSRNDFRVDGALLRSLVKVGLPVALQDGFIQVAFLVITIFANMRGLTDAAAVGIVEKVMGIVFLVPSAMLSSISVMVAQNIGAKRYDAVPQILRYGLIFCVSYGAIVAVGIQPLAGSIVSAFDSSASVQLAGQRYLQAYVWDVLFAGVHFCFSGYFCAIEKSGYSFLHNVISICVARIPISYFAARLVLDSMYPMGLAAPIGSIVSLIVCIWLYRRLQSREKGGRFA